ncbi:hypothetical protein O1C66_000350 [Vibrio cholerae]|nr:hypothetical protein [Vibrio cholerae]
MKDQSIAYLHKLVRVDKEIRDLVAERQIVAKRIRHQLSEDEDFSDCVNGGCRFKCSEAEITIAEDWDEFSEFNFLKAITINLEPVTVISFDD